MSLNTRGTESEASNENLHTLLDGVVLALNIAKDATAAFPPLQSAVGGVAGIIGVVKVSEPFGTAVCSLLIRFASENGSEHRPDQASRVIR